MCVVKARHMILERRTLGKRMGTVRAKIRPLKRHSGDKRTLKWKKALMVKTAWRICIARGI